MSKLKAVGNKAGEIAIGVVGFVMIGIPLAAFCLYIEVDERIKMIREKDDGKDAKKCPDPQKQDKS